MYYPGIGNWARFTRAVRVRRKSIIIDGRSGKISLKRGVRLLDILIAVKITRELLEAKQDYKMIIGQWVKQGAFHMPALGLKSTETDQAVPEPEPENPNPSP